MAYATKWRILSCMTDVKRRYDVSNRRARAEASRGAILAAARDKFGTVGYAKTTMDEIAVGAAVSLRTLYGAFGTKRALLFALLDQMERDAKQQDVLERLSARGLTPHEQLQIFVDFTVRLFSRGRDVLRAMRGASEVEPDAAAAWAEGEGRRHAGVTALVRRWARVAALRPGLSAAAAADVLWALCGPDVYRLVVSERGWSDERFARWLAAMLSDAVLGPVP